MENMQVGGRKGVSIWGAMAGMLVTFVAGIYVGLHPAWIPIKGSGSAVDVSQPAPMNFPTTMGLDRSMPATLPTTAASH